jgi:predicted XRE-type DNA-binding protein
MDDEQFETGSGNVFADLGLPNPDIALKKAELAAKIAERIEECRWSQTKAAELMAIDQPKVSAIVHGRLKDFSLERLITCLERLGQSVGFVFESVKDKNQSRRKVTARTKSSAIRRPKSKRVKTLAGA